MPQWRRPPEQPAYMAPPPPPPPMMGIGRPPHYDTPPHLATYEGLEHISEQVEALRADIAELKALIQVLIQKS